MSSRDGSGPCLRSSEASVQVYFDRSNRGDTTYGIGLNTLDIDFQDHLHWGRRQDFVWGLGYRSSSDSTAPDLQISFAPAALTTHIFSAFVQDEISFHANQVALSLGTKFEHEYYNGFNLQPSARIAWTPDDSDHILGGGLWRPRNPVARRHFDSLQLRRVSRTGQSFDPDQFVRQSGAEQRASDCHRGRPSQTVIAEDFVRFDCLL